MFRTVPVSIIRNFPLYTQRWYMSQFASGIRTFWSYSQPVSKPVWHIQVPLLCVQWKTPDDRQRNCPKHVEFYSENKFEKLVHLVGFIISNINVFNNPSTFLIYALRTFSNSPEDAQDRSKHFAVTVNCVYKFNRNIRVFVGCIVWINYMYSRASCQAACSAQASQPASQPITVLRLNTALFTEVLLLLPHSHFPSDALPRTISILFVLLFFWRFQFQPAVSCSSYSKQNWTPTNQMW